MSFIQEYLNSQQDPNNLLNIVAWCVNEIKKLQRTQAPIETTPALPTVGLSDDNPLADGTAAPGTGTAASRSDHVHPSGGGGGVLSYGHVYINEGVQQVLEGTLDLNVYIVDGFVDVSHEVVSDGLYIYGLTANCGTGLTVKYLYAQLEIVRDGDAISDFWDNTVDRSPLSGTSLGASVNGGSPLYVGDYLNYYGGLDLGSNTGFPMTVDAWIVKLSDL